MAARQVKRGKQSNGCFFRLWSFVPHLLTAKSAAGERYKFRIRGCCERRLAPDPGAVRQASRRSKELASIEEEEEGYP